MKGTAIALLGVFMLGGCLGSKTTETKVDFVEVPKTKIIHEEAPPPEVHTVYKTPDSCTMAAELTTDVSKAANELYNQGDEQLDIMSDGRVAAWKGTGFSEVENAQRDLMSDTIETLSKMQQDQTELDRALAKCKEDTE